MRLTPIQTAVRAFGSYRKVARLSGIDHSNLFQARHVGGANRDPGDIPGIRAMRALLNAAKQSGIPITADMLIYGAEFQDAEVSPPPPMPP